MIVTSTVAVPLAGTVTLGALKVTVARASKKAGTKVAEPVASAPALAQV